MPVGFGYPLGDDHPTSGFIPFPEPVEGNMVLVFVRREIRIYQTNPTLERCPAPLKTVQ